jgi:large subunit ribosomal protein L1
MAIDEQKLRTAVNELHQKKRNFSESFDLLVSLKDLNLKDPKDQVEFFAIVPHTVGKKRTVCALVGPEMIDDASKTVDLALEQSNFERMPKKELRKVAAKYDYFIGQANIMPKIAGSFGRVLGPRGKMPNPKAGCIVPPRAPLQPLVDRLQKTVKVSVKKSPNVQVLIGTQGMSEQQVLDNIKSLYDQIIHHLPKEENNIKAVYLKVTMSKPVKLN